MDLDRLFKLLDSHGVSFAGMVAFAWVSWKLGNELLNTYKERLKMGDDRDERRIVAIENIATTMKVIVTDNEKLNSNQQKTAELLLNNCKYKP